MNKTDSVIETNKYVSLFVQEIILLLPDTIQRSQTTAGWIAKRAPSEKDIASFNEVLESQFGKGFYWEIITTG